jgi:hypothetical protein
MIDGALYLVVLRHALTLSGAPVNSWRLVLAGTPDLCLYLDFDRPSGGMRPVLRKYPGPEDGRPVPGRHVGSDGRTLVTILLPTQGAVRPGDLEAARAATEQLAFARTPAEGPRYVATVLRFLAKGDAVLDESKDPGFNMLGAALSGKVAEAERMLAQGSWRGAGHWMYIPDGSEVLYSERG